MEPEGLCEETHDPDPSCLFLSHEESQANKPPHREIMESEGDTESRQDYPDTTECNLGEGGNWGFS